MKNLLIILLLSSYFFINAQEIKGTVVNNQNMPISSVSISIPGAFLRTVTTNNGKFNLSLANLDYKTDDIIEISSSRIDETVKITIGDYLKLDNKKIIINDGSSAVSNTNKTIEPSKKTPKYTEARKTSLILNKIRKGNQIYIKNQRGKIFYKELIALDNLQKKEFDLNFLEDGAYFFEIEKDLIFHIIPFIIDFENGITYLKDQESTLFKPQVKFENELVKINHMSLEKEPITIDLYDNNTQALLYTETIKGEQDIKRIYKLEKGSFKIVVKSKNKEYATLIDNLD